MGKLTSARLRTLTSPGTYGDGDGLYVQVRGPERRSWLFRYKRHGKTRLMGLGPLADIPLAEARELARDARRLLLQGVDPLERRRAERAEAAARAGLNTFQQVADGYIAAHGPGWRSAEHRQQWRSTLETYAFPVIGWLAVAAVSTGDVMRVLEPIWRDKPKTASRLRGRIEAVLDYASARGWRTGDNPARWRGHLANLLPAAGKLARVVHHSALPWQEIEAFLRALAKQQGVAALALRFTILTAARTGEAIGACWREFDMRGATWTVSADRMKAAREHRVPLSDAALSVLREAAKLRMTEDPLAYVFPGARLGKSLSSMAMFMLLRRMQRADLTTHGFRSTFRDWAGETTAFPREVIEMALAHRLGDAAEQAYARGDLFEKRRRLMAEWAEFCSRSIAAEGDIVPNRGAR